MNQELQAKRSHFLKSIQEGVWHCSINEKSYAFLDVINPFEVEVSSDLSEFKSYRANEVGFSLIGKPLQTPLFEKYILFNRDGKLFFNFLGYEFEIANLFGSISKYTIENGDGRILILKKVWQEENSN